MTLSTPSSSSEALQAMVETALTIVDQPTRMLRHGTLTDEHLAFQSKLLPGSTPGKHLRHVHDHLRILLAAIMQAFHKTSPASLYDAEPPVSIDYDQRGSLPHLERDAAGLQRAFEEIELGLKHLITLDTRLVAWKVRCRQEQMQIRAAFVGREEEDGEDGSSGGRQQLAYYHSTAGPTTSASHAHDMDEERISGLYDRQIELHATTPVKQKMLSTVGRELWFASLHAIHHYALARAILTNELHVQVDPSFGYAPSTLTRLQQRSEHGESKL